MKHEMKLNPIAFEMIKNGKQRFESRLYDDKRKLVKVGDEIEFSKLPELLETITLRVKGLSIANNFKSLYTFINPILGGWEETDSIDKVVDDMHEYYSTEDENNYGVVAIHLEKKSNES
jgi:ASC-1-like (ASCH) protein